VSVSHSRVAAAQESNRIVREVAPAVSADSVEELSIYLRDSFGNPTRIDYGTGHETNFIIFLCAYAPAVSPLDARREHDGRVVSCAAFCGCSVFVRARCV
jgi:hypothetical protein